MKRFLFRKPRRALRRRLHLRNPWAAVFYLGIALSAVYAAAQLDSFLFSRVAIWRFNVAVINAATRDPERGKGYVDTSLWGEARIRAYRACAAFKLESPLAVLSIHRLRLTAPVFNGTDELTLNRGVGRITGTDLPGGNGNLAIAGHRDGFFRALKDIKLGDLIEIETATERDTYIVNATTIVTPNQTSVLQASASPIVTLVTCYPFYFIGDAPRRFIVKAALTRREALQQALAIRQVTH